MQNLPKTHIAAKAGESGLKKFKYTLTAEIEVEAMGEVYVES